MIENVVVPGWPRPRGYSNGVVATGRTLYVAGQIGWEPDGTFVHQDFIGQFDRALGNVLQVVEAAGGGSEHIVRLTIYVTDLDAYRNDLARVGEIYRRRMGKVFPAMALVGVAGLVEKQALVEIEATASLPG
ncbi:MAG: RidA family protein [Polyangiaceae bacterium]|jgi:enamine deaminase RidA (YjgF/YER057c/UK114 family)|nr:RidA family protein [Polyangiaceae bacterium]MBK8936707.1 RidA family protein [Polyangiaceae bacterium]